MNIFKMLKVAIKNYKQNFRVCFLYGTIITLAVSLFITLPEILGFNTIVVKIISAPFSLASAFILPSVTILPVIIALTKPSADGPYTFNDRFSAKFLPFTLLSILTTVVLGVIAVILSVLGAVYIFLHALLDSEIAFLISTLIIALILSFFAIITEMIIFYSQIALTTENIKVSSAFARGFRMLFNNFWRSIGHYIFFGITVMFIPAVLVVLIILSATGFTTLYAFMQLFTILTVIFTALLTPVFIACIVELYRKNWLLNHNIPLTKEEKEEEIFETPDDETIYL